VKFFFVLTFIVALRMLVNYLKIVTYIFITICMTKKG